MRVLPVVMMVVMTVIVAMMVVAVMVMVVPGYRRFRQPASQSRRPPRQIVEARADEVARGRVGEQDLDARVQRAQTPAQRIGLGRRRDIGLGQDEAVGGDDLPARLLMLVERRHAVDRIDERDDAVQPEAHGEIGVVDQHVEDRCGVGEPGRLDDDTAEGSDAAIVAAAQQVL